MNLIHLGSGELQKPLAPAQTLALGSVPPAPAPLSFLLSAVQSAEWVVFPALVGLTVLPPTLLQPPIQGLLPHVTHDIKHNLLSSPFQAPSFPPKEQRPRDIQLVFGKKSR